MKFLAFLMGVLLVGACSSGPETAEDMDETLESKTGQQGEQLGIKDDELTIQKRASIEEKLFKLDSEVQDMQNAVYGPSLTDPHGLWAALQDCRNRKADPRVGGNGSPEPMEKWQNLAETEDDFALTVNKKRTKVVAVSEERLQTRIDRLRSNKRILEGSYQEFKQKLNSCETDYKTALVEHGLNPQDRKAKGEWVMGPNGYKIWEMKKPKTDDPEEMMKRKARGE